VFLILRCRHNETLEQVNEIKRRSPELGLMERDVLCPTQRIVRRVGRERSRVEVEIPIIGSFIFVRWGGSFDWVAAFDRTFPFVRAMHGASGRGYATCEEEEIMQIRPDPEAGELEEVVLKARDQFQFGAAVVIADGVFEGIEGTVLDVNNQGRVRLKVVKNRGLQINALLVPANMLEHKLR
jgi:transcription antitermination factor NusG